MGCTILKEFSYDKFASALVDKANRLRIPLSGSMELTDRCNLRCKHCYINLPVGDLVARQKELTEGEVCRVLDEIAGAGCLWLLLTGGDPLLRPDFLDIYTHAMKRGLLLSLFTNGTMVTPKVADYLAEWPPREVEITLYGMTEATYEAVTGLPGSYRMCIRGIELLHERKLPLGLKTVGLTINRNEIPAMRAYAESLGLKDFRVDYQIHPRLSGSKIPCHLRLSPREIVEREMADPKYRAEFSHFENRAREVRFEAPPDNLYTCGAGLSLFHIDAYGHLSLCMVSRLHSYDILEGSFAEGFKRFMLEARTKARPRDFLCNRCEIEYLCDQCPAQSELFHGVLNKPVAVLCELTHRRAAAIGIYPKNPVLNLRRLDQKQGQENANRGVIPLRVVA